MKRKSFKILFFLRKGKLLKNNGEAPIGMRLTVDGRMCDILIHRSIIVAKFIKTCLFKREIRYVKMALAMLYKLEKATIELVAINQQIIDLTKEFEEKWLKK